MIEESQKRVRTPSKENSNQLQCSPSWTERGTLQGGSQKRVRTTTNENGNVDDSIWEAMAAWGLPDAVAHIYASKGIRKPYRWQMDCVARGLMSSVNLGRPRNIVYTLPTSAGKTFPAEILLLHSVLVRQRKGLMILPYVSLVLEKLDSLKQFRQLNVVTEAYYGSTGLMPLPREPWIIIATIERATGLLNHLLEEGRESELGVCFVDELQLVSEPGRGTTLEALLTKFNYFFTDVQFIGCSATCSNACELASWMGGDALVGEFRPVELHEHLVVEGNVSKKSEDGFLANLRTLPTTTEGDALIALCSEVSQECPRPSILVFLPTRASAKSCADFLTRNAIVETTAENGRQTARLLLLQKLNAISGVHLSETLKQSVLVGIAYHHAGLSAEQRKLIEEGFKDKSLHTLCATSTLAAGVNLPARRVIIRQPYVGKDFLSVRSYRQMAGRAGRKGLDDYGECFLIVSPKDATRATSLLFGTSEGMHIASQIDDESLCRLLLDFVCCLHHRRKTYGIGAKCSMVNATNFVCSTLQSKQESRPGAQIAHATGAIEQLVDECLAKKTDDGEAIEPTVLGQAVYHSGMAITEAMRVHKDIQTAAGGFVFAADDLHTLYLLTCLGLIRNELPAVDMSQLWKHYCGFDPRHLRLAAAIGLDEATMVGLLSRFPLGAVIRSSCARQPRRFPPGAEAAVRLNSALMLRDLLDGVSRDVLASRYNVEAKCLEMLQFYIDHSAWSLASFCKSLGMWALSAVFSEFAKRNTSNLQGELIDITEVKGVGNNRARCLFRGGIRSAADLARAEPEDVASRGGRSFPPGAVGKAVARTLVSNAKQTLRMRLAVQQPSA